MNRRKPRIDVAVVPIEHGQDAESAVLRKACRAAIASLPRPHQPVPAGRAAFAAGYLAGFARHQALKHGVDVERDAAEALRAALAAEAPEWLVAALRELAFLSRSAPGRTVLRAVDPLADAGYLIGHLEALCGTRKLFAMALELDGGTAAIEAYLTACDTAADRLQTHHPTAAIRLDPAERATLVSAFAQRARAG